MFLETDRPKRARIEADLARIRDAGIDAALPELSNDAHLMLTKLCKKMIGKNKGKFQARIAAEVGPKPPKEDEDKKAKRKREKILARRERRLAAAALKAAGGEAPEGSLERLFADFVEESIPAVALDIALISEEPKHMNCTEVSEITQKPTRAEIFRRRVYRQSLVPKLPFALEGGGLAATAPARTIKVKPIVDPFDPRNCRDFLTASKQQSLFAHYWGKSKEGKIALMNSTE